MRTKKQVLEIINLLKINYPVPECTLTYEDAWQLLIGVRLAAQCTDARVNIVTKKLFELYPTLQDIANAGADNIEKIVRPCGLGNSKARDIDLMCNMLINDFNSVVPKDMDLLLKLPGIGRKSANLIRGDIFNLPAIVADTHCIRLSARMGLTSKTKDPLKTERELLKVLPPQESSDYCHRTVLHGRAVCTARKAMCEICCLSAVCEKNI